MFTNIRRIKKELIKFYTLLNENINWDAFFTEIETKTESDPSKWNNAKVLNRIKSKLWTDKSLNESYTQGAIDKMLNKTRLNYFIYYNELINKYLPIINTSDVIYILGVKPNTELLEEFVIDLNYKVNIITIVFTIRCIKCKVVTDLKEVPKNGTLITTGSISFIDDNIKLNDYELIIDDYDNVCIKNNVENDMNINNIKLSTKAMLVSQLTLEEIVELKYNFITVEEYKGK